MWCSLFSLSLMYLFLVASHSIPACIHTYDHLPHPHIYMIVVYLDL